MPRTTGLNGPLFGISAELPSNNATDGLTATKFNGTTISQNYSPPVPIEYAAIAAHNIGKKTATFARGTTSVNLSPPNANSYGVLFTNSANVTNVTFTFPASTQIGIAECGSVFQLPRPLRIEGHEPPLFRSPFKLQPTYSLAGDYLGTLRTRRPRPFSFDVHNVPIKWVRDNIETLYSFENKSFFFWWKPDMYPNDIEFCAFTDKVMVRVTGPRRFCTLGFHMIAYSPTID